MWVSLDWSQSGFRAVVFSGGSKGGYLVAVWITWLIDPSSILKDSSNGLSSSQNTSLWPPSLPPSSKYRDTCDYIGPTQIVQLISSLHGQLIDNLNSILPCRVTYSQIPGIRTWTSLLLLLVTSVVSDSMRPHRRQPTRLPRPWDSPGKNTRDYYSTCHRRSKGTQMCEDLFCLGTEKGSEVSLELLMEKEPDYKGPHIPSTVFIYYFIHCDFEAGNDLVSYFLNSNGMAKH